jgi:predicted DNA-binding transcriptional regulator YafY
MDQPKVERTLRLMKLMTGNTTWTVEELAGKLGTTYRTVYRYIETFREAGFAVRTVRTGVYELVTMGRRERDINRLVYFSDEEAGIINGLIEGLDNTNALKQNLHQKLAAIYDVAPVTDFISKESNAMNVRELSDAIRGKRCVVLRDFKSSSGRTGDRHIEPFAFTTNYIHVWGYDLDDGRCKMFGIARIGEVDVLENEAWTHEDDHRREQMDVFRMSGQRTIRVKLQLDMLARDLLLEEYPLAAQDLKPGQEEGSWLLDTSVCALQGVGRFAIGLADHVKVLDSPELESYIRAFTSRFLPQFQNNFVL